MKKIKVRNSFHNTETTLHVTGGKVSARQINRCWKKLCGITDCRCGGELGERGPQSFDYDVVLNHQTGRIVGLKIK